MLKLFIPVVFEVAASLAARFRTSHIGLLCCQALTGLLPRRNFKCFGYSRHLILCLSLCLMQACGGSDNKAVTPQVPTPPPAQETLRIVTMSDVMKSPVLVQVFAENNGTATLLASGTAQNGLIDLEVQSNSVYKVVVNPNNDIVNLTCPIADGCLIQGSDRVIPFGQTFISRVSLRAYHDRTLGQDIHVNTLTELVSRVHLQNLFGSQDANSLLQAQSLVANLFGISDYRLGFSSNQRTTDDIVISNALDVAFRLRDDFVVSNVNSRLSSVAARIVDHVRNDPAALADINTYWFNRTNHYLMEQVQNCTACSSEQLEALARLRAKISAKRYHPAKGYQAVPLEQLALTSLAKGKQTLTDFRALYYSLESETAAYDRVITDMDKAADLVSGFADIILKDSFPMIEDVLDRVPATAKTGNYKLNDLTISYNNPTRTWALKGKYAKLVVDAKVQLARLSNNINGKNRVVLEANGKINNTAVNSELINVQFALETLVDDISVDTPTRTDSVSVAGSFVLEKSKVVYNGAVNAVLQTVQTQGGADYEVLDSAFLNGTLKRDGNEVNLSLSLINRNVLQDDETGDVIPATALLSVSYNDEIEGLAEPVLTLFLSYKDLKNIKIKDNLDVAAYFAGRYIEFEFRGNNTTFVFNGRNNHGVQWDFVVDKRIPSGDMLLQNSRIGHVRMLKDIPGVMFEDGNFVGIF